MNNGKHKKNVLEDKEKEMKKRTAMRFRVAALASGMIVATNTASLILSPQATSYAATDFPLDQ